MKKNASKTSLRARTIVFGQRDLAAAVGGTEGTIISQNVVGVGGTGLTGVGGTGLTGISGGG